MIFDAKKNLIRYKGLYHNLDIAIGYLLSNDISAMVNGRYDISGDEVYMNVVESKLQEETECCFEVHEKYLDLHIDIIGREKILFARNDAEHIAKEYDAVADYALLNGNANASCDLDEEHFAICMLGEPHMPCLRLNKDTYVKKAIIKIHINNEEKQDV